MSSKKYNTFHEIFDQVDKAKTKKEKIAVLHTYSSAALKTVLGYTFDPGVKWLLPETNPPYKALPPNADQEARLISELKKMYLFVEGPTETQRNLKQAKRELLFINLLEVVDPRDALVVLGMKDGKLPYKGLTRKLVAEAFPNMSANW
jgi:hypothetical protein